MTATRVKRTVFGASDPESEAGKRFLGSLGIKWVQGTQRLRDEH